MTLSSLHYGLPLQIRTMGDVYVKDEFRRHKYANTEHSAIFINEWTNYYVTLAKQLSSKGIVKGFIGKDLEPEMLDAFAEEQLQQLLSLKRESDRLLHGSDDFDSNESLSVKQLDKKERE